MPKPNSLSILPDNDELPNWTVGDELRIHAIEQTSEGRIYLQLRDLDEGSHWVLIHDPVPPTFRF